MEFLHLISQNILSPAILFFALGIAAGFVKSDLEVPDSISRYLSLYLMMAIGFKGGVAIANTHDINGEVIAAIGAGLAIGFLQPFIAYGLLRLTSKLDSPTAAAVAAHYGSISMVTFVTAATFLKAHEVVYAGYIVAILALMEAPAILSGLFIAHRSAPQIKHANEEKKLMSREIFTNGAILLLTGAFFIGWITGQPGMDKVAGFLDAPFQGILCLFLLDMGLLVARNLHHLKSFTWPLALFGIYMPLIGAGIGLFTSRMIGLDVGTGTLFTVLCASASYIAVPAAMRLALPEAKAAIYVPMSLAITFPFNVTLGIPLYFALASKLLINN
ncbi:MAG: sodium-dependent bicarbonate transport family permease [Alphaproteobacteria bacterium]|nr:sodium-dependent bicarbonate transport family permease [Alphaproteobacteria bacterium]